MFHQKMSYSPVTNKIKVIVSAPLDTEKSTRVLSCFTFIVAD